MLNFWTALLAHKVPFQILPELFVSDPIYDGAQKAWENVDDQVVGVADLQDLAGEDPGHEQVHTGWDVGEHAHEQLGPVQKDGVAGTLCRPDVGGHRPCRK